MDIVALWLVFEACVAGLKITDEKITDRAIIEKRSINVRIFLPKVLLIINSVNPQRG